MTVNTERVSIAVQEMLAENPDGTPVYRKGKGYLHAIPEDGDDYWCCIGVFTNIAILHGWVDITRTSCDEFYPRHEHFDGFRQEIFCELVREAYGFAILNPLLVNAEGDAIPAGKWNDFGSHGDEVNGDPEEDFTEIAEGFRRAFLEGVSE